jgi:beta-lactamase class A
VGDKTGSGQYCTANDIGVIFPPGHKPVVVAIYSTREEQNAKWRDDVIAAAARIVVDEFG